MKAGGLHRVVRTMADTQAQMGFDVSVLHTMSGRKYLMQGEPQLSIPLDDSDVVSFHFAPTYRQGTRVLPKGGVRLFHFHGPWAAEALAQGQSSLRYGVKYVMERLVYSRFDTLVTDSYAFARLLHSNYRIPRRRIATVHPGVDVGLFTPGNREEARRRVGVVSARPLFVCVRRLERRMGIADLIEAMVELPDCELLIAGDGSMKASLHEEIKVRALGERVKLLGRVTDETLADLYRAADAVVVPSVALEGFGLIVLEAMACGAPVIATNIGGLGEALGPFALQWSVAPGDRRSLIEMMRNIITDGPSRTDVRKYAESADARASAVTFERMVQTL